MGRKREYCTLICLSSVLLVRISYASFIIVTIEKTFVFMFIFFFLLHYCFYTDQK